MLIFDYFWEIIAKYGFQIGIYVALAVCALVSYICESRDETDGE